MEGREEVALRAGSEVWINHTIKGHLQNSSNDPYINILLLLTIPDTLPGLPKMVYVITSCEMNTLPM